MEELALVATALGVPAVLPDWLGAHLAIAGIPTLTQLPTATRVFVQDTVLVIEGENRPCAWPGRVIQPHHPRCRRLAHRFPTGALHRRGVVAWVERADLIAAGDRVVARIPPQILDSLPAEPRRRSRATRVPDASGRPVPVGV